MFRPEASKRIKKEELIKELYSARALLIKDHHSLYLNRLDSLIHKVKIFGTHFASLDIRQDSRIHTAVILQINSELKAKGKPAILPENYTSLNTSDKIEALSKIDTTIDPTTIDDIISRDTLESMYAIKTIQKENGEEGCHRYVISNCQGIVNMMEVYALLRICGWERSRMMIDIVPLFETIDDLDQAESTMELLYTLPEYKEHLLLRNNHQTIMLGFSDGTKDGGYLQANWSIYTAKENLTAISRKYNVKAKFFDGRGGPPSRGGGKTHKFYSSLGSNIENEEIQLTIQGQTITSNFGTIESSQYNLEQLLSAGLSNELFSDSRIQISQHDRFLMEELGKISHAAYQGFKTHPLFLAYMQQFSPLNYYSKSNIASRPAKRGNSGGLRFEDLRAIPFVGSWSQLKQNVPGFFGVGTALQQMKERGLWNDTKAMFRNVLFFRTLIDNSMMSMLKSFFPLTEYVKKDPQFGPVWEIIKTEFDLTTKLVLELADATSLMEDDKAGKASIQMRDKIVLPLLTIQQYALNKLHNEEVDETLKPVYEKLVTRSMFGVINAARNSA